MALMKACYALKRTVLVSPRVQEIMLSSANQVILDDAPLLEMRADGMTLGQKIIKRGTDIVLSALALLVLSPLMLLIALAIRVEDGGNVIFPAEAADGGRQDLHHLQIPHDAAGQRRRVRTGCG